MTSEAWASSRCCCPVIGSGASPSAMRASVASIMKSPTRLRADPIPESGADDDEVDGG